MESVESQVLTARRSGIFFSDLPRAVLAVRGKDRASFLHNLLSNDIKGLKPGQGKPACPASSCRACLLDRQGKILFCCTAHTRPEEILLEMAPVFLETARAALERYLISEAVEISEATARFQVASVHGPAAANLSLPFSTGPDGFMVQSTLLGMPGLDLWCAKGEAYRPAGIAEGTNEAFDILRIEAGVPWPGREITGEVILNELDREEFVSFTKGCYVGQEIVARIKHRAHPPRLLTGFLVQGQMVPLEGSPILLESQTAGVVTSACFSPTLNRPAAMGFLKYGVEGSFQIQGLPARAVKLPFVSGSG